MAEPQLPAPPTPKALLARLHEQLRVEAAARLKKLSPALQDRAMEALEDGDFADVLRYATLLKSVSGLDTPAKDERANQPVLHLTMVGGVFEGYTTQPAPAKGVIDVEAAPVEITDEAVDQMVQQMLFGDAPIEVENPLPPLEAEDATSRLENLLAFLPKP